MKYIYYSTQRPVGPGTYPKDGLLEIYNFAGKELLPNGIYAWGYLRYDRMLTDQELSGYELVEDPANDLPDVVYCKDCEKHNRDIGDFKEEKQGKNTFYWKYEACPLVHWRGKAQGHGFDYQFCAYGKRKWTSNNEKKWLRIPFLDHKSDAACPEGWFAVEAMHGGRKKQ